MSKEIAGKELDAGMVAFTFLFVIDPREEAGNTYEPLKISVVTQSEDEAWHRIESELGVHVDKLKNLNPTIQKRHIRSGEILISKQDSLANLDDNWPLIVTQGIRDITNAISNTAGVAHKDRIEVELEGVKIDKFIINVFSVAFLASLMFSFYLIVVDKLEPLSRFIFPLITAVIGLIGGYFAGRGSSSRAGRR